MIVGNIYGVVLNDQRQLGRLAPLFGEKPYGKPPGAPVVYMKPRSATNGGPIRIAADTVLHAGATLGLLFGRDATRVSEAEAFGHVAATCLAIDLMMPADSYYRPTIAQRNGDGFLPLGEFSAPALPDAIDTAVDGQNVDRLPLDQLARSVPALVAELSEFMTLQAGDLLLVGLSGDAPNVRAGQEVTVTADSFPPLSIAIERLRA
ncbi:fumarylacetoacetate hydrolase family protein [Sphingomonas sp.]|uniref:fumarylacetoacetate hydrolase family protein n=1 Tax=Sphingomonas sp. TaxID=28214 RepID=UPI002DD66B6B|nr:fumarylacetoacetate hydrolase family protein [Sphingomonas sp.]